MMMIKKRIVVAAIALSASFAFSQVKQTKEQMMFYTSDWKGDRFPDGRPKVPDDLLKRALDCTIEDVWDYLREKGYPNQFEGDWQALHIDKPFAGRALTAQYMPVRADMAKAIAAEGKAEGRVSFNNSWPINELQIGDVYVADSYGKIIDGTLIGSNLGNGIAAHTHTGFVFYGGIRDQEENREIPNFNGFYKGYDPSFIMQMTLTAINAPVRIGRAVVLPGGSASPARSATTCKRSSDFCAARISTCRWRTRTFGNKGVIAPGAASGGRIMRSSER